MELLYGFVLLLIILAGWLILTYNGLIRLRNRVEEAWSDIEVQLKRRYDLIPNIVNTIKGYVTHEKSTLEDVTKARTAAMGAKTMEEHAKAEGVLTETLKSLFAVAESYPNLQATGNFLQLQQELVDAEDKIQSARRFYNSNVRDFNTKLQMFPTNLIASTFGFHARDFFDTPEETKAVPEVKF
jgi:LemA protein